MKLNNAAVMGVIILISASTSLNLKPFITDASSTLKMYVDPPNIVNPALTPGNTFAVDLRVIDAYYVYSWQIYMRWDEAVLEVSNIVFGGFLADQPEGSVNYTRIESDFCLISEATLGRHPGKSASEGLLATATFLVKATGETDLAIDHPNLTKYVEVITPPTSMAITDFSKENGYFRNTTLTYTLTVTSDPISGVEFTIDGTTYTTLWSDNLPEGIHTIIMPSTWGIYAFDHWDDMTADPTRVIDLTSNMTATAIYAAHSWVSSVGSDPIDGIEFTLAGETHTTPWSDLLYEGSYTVIMPLTWTADTGEVYEFDHWEDDSTNPTRVISLTADVTITSYYVSAPEPSFYISASPASLYIQRGYSGVSEITVTSFDGFSDIVALSISGSPSGVTPTLDPAQVSTPPDGSNTSTLTVEVDSSAVLGSHILTVTGTSSALKDSVEMALEIEEPGAVLPIVTVLSPEDKSYANSSITLIFTINKPTSWIGYSLDGQVNVTITGNTTLPGLQDGPHNLIIYANYTTGISGSSCTIYFTIDTSPPVADSGPDQTVNEDTPVAFDGSTSQDENGIVGYTWTFVDVTPKALTGLNPTYIFATPGTYIVTLTVVDAAGNIAIDTVTITVLLDTDGDGTPDITDADDDNDGVNDVDDAFPLDALESMDTDEDGVGNNADTDDDNDGMPDTWETENGFNLLDATDASHDSDGDGLTNLEEYQQGKDPNISNAEAFPLWVVGMATAVLIGIAVAATFLWRRRE